MFALGALAMMARMPEHGEDSGESPHIKVPRSRLADYADGTVTSKPPEEKATSPHEDTDYCQTTRALGGRGAESGAVSASSPLAALQEACVRARQRDSAAALGDFRRTSVLVPVGDGPGPGKERGLLTADLHGVRFILAFSDEQALARYAVARGETAREWTYQTILGARLLDVAVPAAGAPCGVALNCADGEQGMVFPPVRGVVPEGVAVDVVAETGDGN